MVKHVKPFLKNWIRMNFAGGNGNQTHERQVLGGSSELFNSDVSSVLYVDDQRWQRDDSRDNSGDSIRKSL